MKLNNNQSIIDNNESMIENNQSIIDNNESMIEMNQSIIDNNESMIIETINQSLITMNQ